MKKLAHYHSVSDKGLELISKIAYMNDAVRHLIVNSSEEHIIKVAQYAKELEEAMNSYRATLIDSFSALSSEEEEPREISAFKTDNGFKV